MPLYGVKGWTEIATHKAIDRFRLWKKHDVDAVVGHLDSYMVLLLYALIKPSFAIFLDCLLYRTAVVHIVRVSSFAFPARYTRPTQTMKDWQLREMIKRSAGTNGKLQVAGRPIGILDVTARREMYDGENGAMEEEDSDEGDVKQPEKRRLDVKAIFDEVVYQGGTIPTTKEPEPRKAKITDEYNPEAPQLALPLLLQRIAQSERVRTEREATQPYIHNPHFLYHTFGDAPYTVHLCKRCTRRRKCALHREVFQQQTSISLCPHVRMNLYWAVNDPVNAHSSWNLQIKEYFGESRDGCWSRNEEEKERRDHEECSVFKGSERVRTLAERVVEDIQREISGGRRLRGNVRRVENEIGVLLGAWERAVEARERRREKESRAREKRKRVKMMRAEKANKMLVKTLELVEEMKRMKDARGNEDVKEVGVAQSVEEVSTQTVVCSELPAQSTPPKAASPASTPKHTPTSVQKVEIVDSAEEEITQMQAFLGHPAQPKLPKSGSHPSNPKYTPTSVEEVEVVQSVEEKDDLPQAFPSSSAQPTPPKSASPSAAPKQAPIESASPSPPPSALENLQSLPDSPITRPPSPSPLPSPTPPTSPLSKRKRSTTHLPPSLPAKKAKRVHWTPEIDASLDTERPRVASPEFERDERSYSPVAEEEDSPVAEEEEGEVVRRVVGELMEDSVDWGEGSDDDEEVEEEEAEEEE